MVFEGLYSDGQPVYTALAQFIQVAIVDVSRVHLHRDLFDTLCTDRAQDTEDIHRVQRARCAAADIDSTERFGQLLFACRYLDE